MIDGGTTKETNARQYRCGWGTLTGCDGTVPDDGTAHIVQDGRRPLSPTDDGRVVYHARCCPCRDQGVVTPGPVARFFGLAS